MELLIETLQGYITHILQQEIVTGRTGVCGDLPYGGGTVFTKSANERLLV